jgi:hypothetical protein
MEVMSKLVALDPRATAVRMLQHIAGLLLKYPDYNNIPILIVPENNTRHVAAGLYQALADQYFVAHYTPHLNFDNIKFYTKRPTHDDLSQQDFMTLLKHAANGGGFGGESVTSILLPGVRTDNNNKTLGVSRLESRLHRGGIGIALAPDFLSTTVTSDGKATVAPDVTAQRLKKELQSFQAIAPQLGKAVKVVTYSGKPVNENDDAVMALMVLELGNAEYEMQVAAHAQLQQRAI